MSGSGTGGKGGVAGAPAGGAPTGGTYQPLAPQGNFNVNQAAAGGLQQAIFRPSAQHHC